MTRRRLYCDDVSISWNLSSSPKPKQSKKSLFYFTAPTSVLLSDPIIPIPMCDPPINHSSFDFPLQFHQIPYQCRLRKEMLRAVAAGPHPRIPHPTPTLGITATSSRSTAKSSVESRIPISGRLISLALIISSGSISIASLPGFFLALHPHFVVDYRLDPNLSRNSQFGIVEFDSCSAQIQPKSLSLSHALHTVQIC